MFLIISNACFDLDNLRKEDRQSDTKKRKLGENDWEALH